jgi:hypothetical protein
MTNGRRAKVDSESSEGTLAASRYSAWRLFSCYLVSSCLRPYLLAWVPI